MTSWVAGRVCIQRIRDLRAKKMSRVSLGDWLGFAMEVEDIFGDLGA